MGTKQTRTELLRDSFKAFREGTAKEAEASVELLYELTLSALSKSREKEKLKLAKEYADLKRQKIFRRGLVDSNGEHHPGVKDGVLKNTLDRGDAVYSWTLLQYLNRLLQKKNLVKE